MKSAWKPWKSSLPLFFLFWIGCTFVSGPALAQPRDSNLCVKDVPTAFQKIQDHGTHSGIWIKNWRPKGDHYPLSWKDYLKFRKLRKQSHIQGIQRLPDKPYFIMTGSSEGKNLGHFYIGKVAQMDSDEKVGTSLNDRNIPVDGATVVQREDFPVLTGNIISTDHKYTHAGGLQIIGDYAVVALGHGGEPERVVFYDLSSPEHPRKLPYEVNLERADAVAIAKQSNGKYLLMVRGAQEVIEIFESDNSSLENPQFQHRTTWKSYISNNFVGSQNGVAGWRNYQNINLVNSCDGQLYLIGFARDPGKTLGQDNPLKGEDWIDLFRVDISFLRDRAPWEVSITQPKILSKIEEKHIYCEGFCNFAAGGGIYISKQGEFIAYGVKHFIPTDQEEMAAQGQKNIPPMTPTKAAFIKINEFRSFPPSVPLPLTEPEHSWVAMYDDAHFKGPMVFLEGKDVADKEWANFKDVWNNFDKKVSSVQWLIPKGYQYGLYRHAEFKGQALWLNGTGNVDQLARLRPLDFNDRPSSSKLLKVRITDSQDGWVELFTDPDFDGRRLRITPLVKTCPGSVFHNLKCLKGEVAWEWREHQGFSNYKNLKNVDGKDGFDNKITSIRFQLPLGKRYRLYQHPDYQGNTFDLVGNGLVQEIPDMRKVDKELNNKFSSSKFLN